MKILVTGAGGAIGRVLGRGLPDQGHELRALDLNEQSADDGTYGLGWIAGDCLDQETVDRAVAGVDAVVHLAGNPDEDSLPASLESHVHTTGHILEAMVRHGVSRLAYASSNHAVGRTPYTELLTTSVPPRPDTFYGVAKVAAESLLSLYADRHGLSAVAMRIGSFGHEPQTRRQLSTWLSPGDAVRIVSAAVAYPEPGLHMVYGISDNSRGWWDLEPGHAIGYHPRDDAEDFASTIPSRPEDEFENTWVGGPHVNPSYAHAAF